MTLTDGKKVIRISKRTIVRQGDEKMRKIKSANREAFDDGWDKALTTLSRIVEKHPADCCESKGNAECVLKKMTIISLIEESRK